MDHVVKDYDSELVRLKSLVLEMSSLTVEQLESVLQAALGSDANAAARVIQREPDADRRELEIDKLVVRLLATRQPVAVDLRDILAALRIANELERICDHAEDAATKATTPASAAAELTSSLADLGRFAVTMVRDATSAYAAADADQAQRVWQRRKEIDEIYVALFRRLLVEAMKNPHRIVPAAQLALIAGDIERAGARATNIAEMVYYRVTGLPMAGPRPRADSTRILSISLPS